MVAYRLRSQYITVDCKEPVCYQVCWDVLYTFLLIMEIQALAGPSAGGGGGGLGA